MRLELGLCLLNLFRADEALPHLSEVLARRPDDPAARYAMARCLRLAGTDRARSPLDGSIRDDPADPRPLAEWARVALDEGSLPDAEAFFRRAVTHPPYAPKLLLEFAQVLERVGKTREATQTRERFEAAERDITRLEEFVRSMPAAPALRLEAGRLFLRMYNERAGLRFLSEALKIDPGYKPAHAALAEFYEKRQPQRAAFHRGMAGT